ncbi:MAG: hypothetical protein GX096_13090 [Clostridiales bacterium]|nr:hypothetical protein [Clostridiales bacterium]
MNHKNLGTRILRATAGLVFFAVGVYLTIQANIGLSPWDCFAMGVSKQLPITYGQASIVISFLILGVDLLLGERIGIGTILDAFVIGIVIDLLQSTGIVPAQTSVPVGIVMMIIGLFIMSFGQYIYMTACLCCGPRDAMLVGIGKRLSKTPIGAVNVLILVCVLLVGWMLGGKVGIGSLIASVCIGVTMQIVFKLLNFEPRNLKHESLWDTFKRKTIAEG